MSIRPTFTTMGQSSPASVSDDAGGGYYKYRGDKPLKKGAPAEPSTQNARAMKGRAARLAEFRRLRRAEKLTKEQAAERLGISRSTMQVYEREFLESQEPQT